MEDDKVKEQKYLKFLEQEYFAQKSNYNTIVNQYNLKITICGIIVGVFSKNPDTILLTDLIVISTLLFIAITSYKTVISKQIQNIDCYNIGTIEEVIKFNSDEYNKEQHRLKVTFLIFLALSISISFVILGTHLS